MTRSRWQLSLLSSQIILLGVLVPFGQRDLSSKPQQYCFLVCVFLFGLGILLLGVSSTGELYYRKKGIDAFYKELKKAYLERRYMEQITVSERKSLTYCGNIGLLCSALALVSLVVLVFLKILYP